MATHLYTVEQVADLLNLHVKTIRRYVRDGRLKATRIGKEYRIARTDLDALTGGRVPATVAVSRTRHVIASTIVDIDAISPEESHRITTLVMASLNARRGEGDFPTVNSIYYPDHGKLRITITGNLALTTSLLQLVDVRLKDGRS